MKEGITPLMLQIQGKIESLSNLILISEMELVKKKKKKVSTEKKEGSAKYWEKRFPEKLRRLNL